MKIIHDDIDGDDNVAAVCDNGHVAISQKESSKVSKTFNVFQVELLWRRALANKGDKFYCLANVDKLDLDDSVKAKKAFDQLENEYDSGNANKL